MNKIPFPSALVGEWTALRTDNPSGLFGYRHSQALQLMHFPDYGSGDMTAKQRRDALNMSLVIHKPMTALIIFLNVVALEDLIRNQSINLSNITGLNTYFPNISTLNSSPKLFNPNKPSKQLDNDPFPILDYLKLNTSYLNAMGVEPIPQIEHPKLYDLSIIRHTVAHHGSIIRSIDTQRFQYYEVSPNQQINPPIEFVKEIGKYLYEIGSQFRNSIQEVIFFTLCSAYSLNELRQRPQLLKDLVEEFNYFGHMPQMDLPFPQNETEKRENHNLITETLLKHSFDLLEIKYYS